MDKSVNGITEERDRYWSFNTLMREYNETWVAGGDERLGQWFCNRYIKQAWPGLYYASLADAMLLMIRWLRDNHYERELPPRVDEEQNESPQP